MTSSATTFTAQVAAWQTWNNVLTTTTANTPAWLVWNAPIQLSHEQLVAGRHERFWAAVVDYVRRVEEALAAGRAEALLMDHLDKEQRNDLLLKHCFYLHVGRKRYRVDRGRSGNVKLLNDAGSIVRKYCIHPVDASVPVADVMLSQKLLLEANEEEFLKIANAS